MRPGLTAPRHLVGLLKSLRALPPTEGEISLERQVALAARLERCESLIRWLASVHGIPMDTVLDPFLPADPFGELKRAVQRRLDHLTQLVEENERMGSARGALDRENRALKEAAREVGRHSERMTDSLRLMELQLRAMGVGPR